MTPEQHNVLSQLAQLGLQKLTDDAKAALQSCAPVVEPAESEGDAP